MTINRKPYYDSVKDRWYCDKDKDNKWTYVWDVTNECNLNNTTISSATLTNDPRITILKGPTVQSGLYALVQLSGPTYDVNATDDAYVTVHFVCANGDEFDKTVWFKAVVD